MKMTLADVIDTLQTWIRNADDEYDREEMGRVAGLKEALHEIKKIEPCEDAISRQAALDAVGLSEKSRKYGGDHSGYDTIMLYEVQDALEALSSVQPQTKTGHWRKMVIVYDALSGEHKRVPYTAEDEKMGNVPVYNCDCGCKAAKPHNYCPDCGVKMAESEDKE